MTVKDYIEAPGGTRVPVEVLEASTLVVSTDKTPHSVVPVVLVRVLATDELLTVRPYQLDHCQRVS